MAALAQVRKQWLDRPEMLVRAARHYEGAMQILIRRAVLTARQVEHLSSVLIALSTSFCPANSVV